MDQATAEPPAASDGGAAQATDPLLARRRAANDTIRKYVLMAMGAGLIPSPLVDTVAVTALEVKMIADLGRVYDFPVPHKLVALKVLISLASSIGMIYLAVKFNSVVKAVPGVGHAVHASLLAISGGAAVYAVGKIFQEYYESGGSFLGKSDAELRREFEAKYREGMEVVPQWAKA